LKYYSVVHFLNVSEASEASVMALRKLTCFYQNTMDLGGTGFDAISVLSGQLKGNDPWNVLVDEDTDW
jgi:hypothetical protein